MRASCTITFRCEGCGLRVVRATAPVVYSSLAMGCTLGCTLAAVSRRHDIFKRAVARRQFEPGWLAQMAQAEMRPQQWLRLTERELHDEVARLRELVHREALSRDHPELVAVYEQLRRASLADEIPPTREGA
jgi:hypothetical protein